MLRLLSLRLQASFTIHQSQSFRKKLPTDYKFGNKHSHKNPHAIPMRIKDNLLKSHKGGNWKKIRELQRQSLKPFGHFKKTGFVFDKQKLPFYDIPDLDGFDLQPYVEFNAPQISQQLLNYQQEVNQQKIEKLRSA